MPVELTERKLRDAIALLGESELDGAQAARSALEWIGWQGEGPLLLRCYDVQLFLWYVLPRKFLASLDDKREAAAALARTLEHLGGRAARYAQLCTSAATDELLIAWEHDEPAAWRRFRQLLDGSGIEPPDTDLLAWGQVMGFEEARARELVATALEEAIEDGRLTLGASAFKRRQAQLVGVALRERADAGDALTVLELVHRERLERWLQRGHTRGSAERRSALEPIAAIVAAAPPCIEPTAARAAVAPARWLLERARDGVALTQTGALNRALVREAVERWPDWWPSELFGPPNRERDVALLHELHGLLRRLRLLRRSGRQIVITTRGRKLHGDPSALLSTLAVELLAGESFAAACVELAGALILGGATVGYSEELATRVHPAIVAEGWRSAGEHPSQRDVAREIANLLRPAEAVGLVASPPGSTRRTRDNLVLTTAGRAALTIGLRARALQPSSGPY